MPEKKIDEKSEAARAMADLADITAALYPQADALEEKETSDVETKETEEVVETVESEEATETEETKEVVEGTEETESTEESTEPVEPQPADKKEVPITTLNELEQLRNELRAAYELMKQIQAKAAEEKPKEITLEAIEFIKEDDVLDNAKINELLNKAMQEGAKRGYDLALKAIPDIASNVATNAAQTQLTLQNFYTKNPELAQYDDFVGFVGNQIREKAEKAGETITPAILLERTAIEAKKRLGFGTKGSKQQPSSERKAPVTPFASTSGARKPGPKQVSRVEKDLADLEGGYKFDMF